MSGSLSFLGETRLNKMNRLFPGSCVQWPCSGGSETLDDHFFYWVKLPQANLKRPKSLQVTRCSARCKRWKHQDGLIRKKTVPGSLHEALAPVIHLGLDRRQNQVLQGNGRKILRNGRWFPSHEYQVSSAKAIQCKFSPSGMVSVGGTNGHRLIQENLLKFGEKVGLTTFEGRNSWEITPGIVASKMEASGGKLMGRGWHDGNEVRTKFAAKQASRIKPR